MSEDGTNGTARPGSADEGGGWSPERLVDATDDDTVRPRPRRPKVPLPTNPRIVVDPQVLARYRARVLDPATAARIGGRRPPEPTVYLSDRLVLSSSLALEPLAEAARANGLQLVENERRAARRSELVELAARAGVPDPEQLVPTLVDLEPRPGRITPVDAWAVLQTFRSDVGVESDLSGRASLDHLVTATKHFDPGPYTPPGGAQSVSAPSASYGLPGWGGRGPVAWIGAAPQRARTPPARRPVVAVLDTGCGRHTWLPDTIVDRAPTVDGTPGGVRIGLHPDLTEVTGVVSDVLEGELDPDSGHGTFISGVIRQQCPEADLLAVRVMPSIGAAPEHVVLDALVGLVIRQYLARQGRPDLFVDLVSMSMGYYHEDGPGAAAGSSLFVLLDALATVGVAAVASAGNDATSRAMFPAAFCPHEGGAVAAFTPGSVPVLSVGARNPNGSVALFSNDGPWVACRRIGANIVSTFPPFDGSSLPAYGAVVDGEVRESLDVDDFTGGFGTWSGTSFAAPVLAGELAHSLASGTCGDLADLSAPGSIARAWTAITERTGIACP